MNFYAQSTNPRTYGRTVYAFPTKRLRDYVVAHVEDIGACSAAYGREVMKKDEENMRGYDWNGYDFLDMRLGEYWWDEFEPLWDETHDLGLW
jgi:hypothetical protein